DCLYALSTVLETMDFAARLRLPKETPGEERERRVDEVLRQLGLAHVRDTNVGGTSFNGALRGLSGGERKRLSIGIELLHSPSILFLDEPTTGLDSYQALNVMKKLQGLAEEGRTVIVSIHQPRSQIFALFTSLCVLSRGAPVYSGSAEKATDYFAGLGHPLPSRFNPADFMIDLVSVDQISPEAQEETGEGQGREPAQVLVGAPRQRRGGRKGAPAWRRAVRGIHPRRPAQVDARRPRVLCDAIRAVAAQGVAGADAGQVRRAVQDDVSDGLHRRIRPRLFPAGVQAGQHSGQGDAPHVPLDEHRLRRVDRHCADHSATAQYRDSGARQPTLRHHSVLSADLTALAVSIPPEVGPQILSNVILFFMANLSGSFWIFSLALVLETMVFVSVGMFLSALLPSVTMAPQIAPAIVIIFLIFNGNFINVDSVPVYFVWLREISPIKYAFQALAVNEFEDATFECDSSDIVCIETGEQVLSQLKFTEADLIMKSCAILGVLMVAFNIIALGMLLYRKPKFLQPVPAKVSGAA
ncbi:unnamed protein product, partial [Prorocentrum cordatum]